jgi:hypothetical protein
MTMIFLVCLWGIYTQAMFAYIRQWEMEMAFFCFLVALVASFAAQNEIEENNGTQ